MVNFKDGQTVIKRRFEASGNNVFFDLVKHGKFIPAVKEASLTAAIGFNGRF